MNLLEKAKTLPTTSGVYLMKDSSQQIIYVGKSKNLKNRVSSYFQKSNNHPKKVERMVNHLTNFEYILTDTEFEAFMLECKLIKEIQPMYNRMMKTPKAYTYIVFRWQKGRYQLEVTNSLDSKDIHYFFGPFTGKQTVEKAVNSLKEYYKLNCTNPLQENSPCLNYSLNLCIGICFSSVAKTEYDEILNNLISLFKGTDQFVLEEMQKSMEKSAISFEFEKAAKIRDTLELLHTLIKKESVINFTKENHNIIAGEWLDESSIKIFFIKGKDLLFQEMYNRSLLSSKSFINKLKKNVYAYFSEKENTLIDVEKEEIDQAQIVYRYLKSNNSHYILLPQKVLNKHDSMEQHLNDFIKELCSYCVD